MPNDTMKQINCFANDIAAGKAKTDDDVRALLDAVRSALNVDVISLQMWGIPIVSAIIVEARVKLRRSDMKMFMNRL